MTTKFKILFMTELLHDYYSNLQCNDFTIVPSEETRQLLMNRQLMYKQAGNKLIVLVKVFPDGPEKNKPFVALKTDDRFLFYLQLNRPEFNAVTNLDTDKLRAGKRFYFTNLERNDLDNELSLTQKIVQVPGVANYVPGDLAADAGGIIYECIKSTSQVNNPPAPAFWHNRGKQQYVSGRDMIRIQTRIANYRVTTKARQFSINVSGLNRATGIYDLPVPVSKNLVITDSDTDEVQADLSELAAGRYIIDINGDQFEHFIDDTAVYNNVYGILEIFAHFAGGPGFPLLNADGTVKDKDDADPPEWLQYKIRFANRLAYWKYKTPRHGVTAITDAGLQHTFNPTPAAPGDKEFFTSAKPIPLLQMPWKFKVNVQSLSTTEDPLAPNPDPAISGMLSRTKDPDYDYYCTINLHY